MVKKIAVLRANALGDYVFVLPALQALKETFYEAEVVLLGRGWHKEYLCERPGPVDRVVVVPPYPGVSEREGYIPKESELEPFFAAMQREQFDLAFQLHGGGRNSNPFVRRLGAGTTVGLKTPDAPPLDINVPYIYYFNETLRYLEVVRRVGARSKNLEPAIVVTDKDLAEAHKVVENPLSKPLAVLHPGASEIRRRWPGENFAAVADFLTDKGYHVCVTGLAWEREIVDEVMHHVADRCNVQDVSAKLTLGGTTGLLSMADMVVSNDTGPMHLARALRKPSVGIFWCANIINAAPMSITLNRNLLSWTMRCPKCGLSSFELNAAKGDCHHNVSMVADVTIADAKAAIEDLENEWRPALQNQNVPASEQGVLVK